MQANKNINLWKEKAPVYQLFRSKAPKTQQIRHYRHMRKTGELFLLFNTGADFNLRNNFADAGSFCKFPFLFISMIPWWKTCIN